MNVQMCFVLFKCHHWWQSDLQLPLIRNAVDISQLCKGCSWLLGWRIDLCRKTPSHAKIMLFFAQDYNFPFSPWWSLKYQLFFLFTSSSSCCNTSVSHLDELSSDTKQPTHTVLSVIWQQSRAQKPSRELNSEVII